MSNERQKRKGMMIEEDYIPPAKRMRQDPEAFVMTKQEREATLIQFTDRTYAQQVIWWHHLWEGQKVPGTQVLFVGKSVCMKCTLKVVFKVLPFCAYTLASRLNVCHRHILTRCTCSTVLGLPLHIPQLCLNRKPGHINVNEFQKHSDPPM